MGKSEREEDKGGAASEFRRPRILRAGAHLVVARPSRVCRTRVGEGVGKELQVPKARSVKEGKTKEHGEDRDGPRIVRTFAFSARPSSLLLDAVGCSGGIDPSTASRMDSSDEHSSRAGRPRSFTQPFQAQSRQPPHRGSSDRLDTFEREAEEERELRRQRRRRRESRRRGEPEHSPEAESRRQHRLPSDDMWKALSGATGVREDTTGDEESDSEAGEGSSLLGSSRGRGRRRSRERDLELGESASSLGRSANRLGSPGERSTGRLGPPPR